ncbi:hypothetical protein [Streptomyces sp. MK37H]|uniref:hypothetical protein n=1 Tax=Streptomyces sp. MK37H TaxID=2699117 RepID=UPI001B372FBE|nr:hypothetical protein [Streptomyces sp. MK37H]MBP8532293.1 hypothetical protein [Streptomyces sp. MK37H]
MGNVPRGPRPEGAVVQAVDRSAPVGVGSGIAMDSGGPEGAPEGDPRQMCDIP